MDPILPSNQSPLGALPARFRRQRVLVVGCGDVGMRVARDVLEASGGQFGTSARAARLRHPRLLALTSSPERLPLLRALGMTPILGNLDDAASLRRLSGMAHRVLHLAPPPSEGAGGPQWWRDPRTEALTRALRLRSQPQALVYGSTSGVYGDCQGALVAESRPVKPHTPRAQRRVSAEAAVRHLGRSGVRTSILRIPGIYAPDREGGTPATRLQKGTPVLESQDDVYTNHIHADDLARACWRALWRGRPQRVYNVNDFSALKMGDYFDLAADLYGMARPPRIPRSTAQDALPLMLLSFMGESRLMDNRRLTQELGLRLRYPTVREGLQSVPLPRPVVPAT